MPYIGMLAFGIFVGGIASVGIQFIKDQDGFVKLAVAILSGALSGSAMVFFGNLKSFMRPTDTLSVFMYPVGLLLAFVWVNYPGVIAQPNRIMKYGGVFSMVLMTVVAAALAVFPDFRAFVNK